MTLGNWGRIYSNLKQMVSLVAYLMRTSVLQSPSTFFGYSRAVVEPNWSQQQNPIISWCTWMCWYGDDSILLQSFTFWLPRCLLLYFALRIGDQTLLILSVSCLSSYLYHTYFKEVWTFEIMSRLSNHAEQIMFDILPALFWFKRIYSV